MVSVRRLHLDPEQAAFQTAVVKHQEHESTVTSISVQGKYSGAAYHEARRDVVWKRTFLTFCVVSMKTIREKKSQCLFSFTVLNTFSVWLFCPF